MRRDDVTAFDRDKDDAIYALHAARRALDAAGLYALEEHVRALIDRARVARDPFPHLPPRNTKASTR